MLIEDRRGSDDWKHLFALPLDVAAGKNVPSLHNGFSQ